MALGQSGDAALPSLLQAFADEDVNVRWAAANALGALGNAQALPSLLQGLADEDAEVRWAAADALGALGDTRALPALLQALTDEEATVRAAAAKALGGLGDARALPSLLQALAIKKSGIRWLLEEAATPSFGPSSALTQANLDEAAGVRWVAAEALGKIGDTQVLPALLQALTNKPSGARWALQTRTFGVLPPPNFLEQLDQADVRLRRSAAWALAQLLPIASIKQLRYAIRTLRWRAAEEVEEAYPLLIQAMNHLTKLEVATLPPTDPIATSPKPFWYDWGRGLVIWSRRMEMAVGIAFALLRAAELGAIIVIVGIGVAAVSMILGALGLLPLEDVIWKEAMVLLFLIHLTEYYTRSGQPKQARRLRISLMFVVLAQILWGARVMVPLLSAVLVITVLAMLLRTIKRWYKRWFPLP